MSDTQSQFSVLKQTADRAVADAIARLIEDGEDHELNRINALDFAKRTGFDEEKVISGFLHASRLGLFDLTWNVLCPGCSGVLDAHDTLKSLRDDDYHCGLCACGYEPSVDEQVEVAFTVSPKIRRIAAHDPNTLPLPGLSIGSSGRERKSVVWREAVSSHDVLPLPSSARLYGTLTRCTTRPEIPMSGIDARHSCQA